VTPALIQELAPEVLRHRLGLTYEAEAAGQTTDDVVRRVIHDTPVPST
jgi:MoxR-like ATPase